MSLGNVQRAYKAWQQAAAVAVAASGGASVGRGGGSRGAAGGGRGSGRGGRGRGVSGTAAETPHERTVCAGSIVCLLARAQTSCSR